MLSTLARLLRLASIAICLIAVAYLLTFALNQTNNASNHQQAEINALPGTPIAAPPTHEGRLHEAVDEVFSKLSSPFSGVTSGSTNQWVIHLVNTALVLLVYGFGLAFVARILRVSP